MKKELKIIMFILAFLVYKSAKGFSDYEVMVENAAKQISYLEEYNQFKANSDKWYIYFLGKDVAYLNDQLFKSTSNQTFSTSFLEQLNDLLISINSGNVAMYVAVTDIDSPIVLPLIPNLGSIEDNIDFLKKELENPSGIGSDLLYNDEIKKGKEEYEAYENAFQKLLKDIYDNSSIAKSEKDFKLLPFYAFHEITHSGNVNNESNLYLSNTIYSGGKSIDSSALEDKLRESASFGSYWYETNISKTISSFYKYFVEGTTFELEGVEVILQQGSDLYTSAYENRNLPDTDFSSSAKILDFSGIASQQDKAKLSSSLETTTLLEGMQMYVVFTDDDTRPDILQNLQNLEVDTDKYYTWLHINRDGSANINTIVHQDFDEKLRRATQHWTGALWDVLELNTNKATKDFLFNYLKSKNHLMHYLSGLIGHVSIPAKYWDPSQQDYINEMQYVAQIMEGVSGNVASVFNAQQAQMAFAFKTGIWNGIVEEVKGLIDLGALVTDYITDQDKAREFDQAIGGLSFDTLWKSFEEAHGYQEELGLNEFQLAHQLGKDVVFVASFFVGIGELTSVTKMSKALNGIADLLRGSIKFSKKLSDDSLRILKEVSDKALKKSIAKKIDELFSVSYLDDLGGEAGLNRIIDAAVKNKDDLVKPLDEYLDDLKYALDNYRNLKGNGYEKLITEAKNSNVFVQDGLSHSLNKLRTLNPKDVKKMDMKFEEPNIECSNCRFDIEMVDDYVKTTGIRFFELKSYKISSIKGISINQFKSYLQSIDNLDQLRYVFNKNKTPNLKDIKDELQKVFGKNSETIFEANENIAKSFDLPNGNKVGNLQEFKQLIDTEFFLDQLKFIEIK